MAKFKLKNPFKKSEEIKSIQEPSSTTRLDDINGDTFYPILLDYLYELTPKKILDLYYNSSAVFSCVDILASANANKKYIIKDLKTGAEIPKEETNPVLENIRKLLSSPNPLQSISEYERYCATYYFLFGNSFDMANINIATKYSNIMDMQALWQLPSQYVQVNATDDYFYKTELSEIIKSYSIEGSNLSFSPFEINHINEPNLNWDSSSFEYCNPNFKGVSRLNRLITEIRNINSANDITNSTLEENNMLGLLTPPLSSSKDGFGSNIPLEKEEKEIVQRELRNYGAKTGQYKYAVLSNAMQYQRTILTPTELGVFETIDKYWTTVATVFNINKQLLSQNLNGAKYDNQIVGLQELYVNNIIPYSKLRDVSLNNFFKLKDYNYYIESSFEHLSFLQNDKKDQSITNKNNSSAYKEAFMMGAINYGAYLEKIGLPQNKDIGDKYIFDLSSEELLIIK